MIFMVNYKSYLTFVQEFGSEDWVKNQLNMRKKPNFWTILEYGEKSTVNSYEIRLARMFRWLLDPNATHGLGNIFAHKLLQFYNEGNQTREETQYDYSPNKNPNIQVTSEEKHIDLLYKDFEQGVIVAIELKHYADEGVRKGVSQLVHYENEIKKMIEGKSIEPYCFYLTPTGKSSSRSELTSLDKASLKFRWIPISYETFIRFIEEVEVERMKEKDIPYITDTRKIISDFKDDLQRSIDIMTTAEKKAMLNDQIKPDYITLTQNLAKKIMKQEHSRDLQKLLTLNKDSSFELEEIILIINDAITAQNHAPNVGVQMLTRKIYNYFSTKGELPYEPTKLKLYEANKQFDKVAKDGLPLNKIMITREKGQGLYLYHESLPYRIYMSGDAYGNFPNDGVQLLPIKKKDGRAKKIPLMNGKKFLVEETTMLKNQLKTTDGSTLTFDEFIRDYLVVSLKDAVDQINNLLDKKNMHS